MAKQKDGPPRSEPSETISDLGPKVVAYVYKTLQVDERWSVREPRGFTWWGYRLAQRVWAEPARDISGDLTVCLHAETDLLRNVALSKDPSKDLTAFNGMTSFSAFVWDPDNHRVMLHCTAYVHPQVEWIETIFSNAVIMQNIEAHSRAHGLRELIGGDLALSSHPKNGDRPQMDDMLNVAEKVVIPIGQKESPFAGQDLMALLNSKPAPWALATGDATGLTAEIPFRDAVPAVVRAAAGSKEDVGTGLLRVFTTERHPSLGSGALLTLQLPVRFKAGKAADEAQALNRAESQQWTNFPLLGAWSVDPQSDDGVAYVSFIPSAFRRPGLLEAMCWYMAGRCRWAHDALTGASGAGAPPTQLQTAQQPEADRHMFLTNAISLFLSRPEPNRYLYVEVKDRPQQNVELSLVTRGLRAVIGQGRAGVPGATLAAGAAAKLEAMGFSGGGTKGRYRSNSVPRDPERLAEMIDHIMILAFGLDQTYEASITDSR